MWGRGSSAGTALSCSLAPRLSRPPFQRRGGRPNQGVAEPSPSSRESRKPPPPPSTPRALPPEAVWAPPGPLHQRPGHWGPCSGLPSKSLLSRGAGGSPPPSTRGQPGPVDRPALQGAPPLAAELETRPSKRMPSGRRLGCQAGAGRVRGAGGFVPPALCRLTRVLPQSSGRPPAFPLLSDAPASQGRATQTLSTGTRSPAVAATTMS